MNRKEIDLLLSRIEGLKSFLENNSLENSAGNPEC